MSSGKEKEELKKPQEGETEEVEEEVEEVVEEVEEEVEEVVEEVEEEGEEDPSPQKPKSSKSSSKKSTPEKKKSPPKVTLEEKEAVEEEAVPAASTSRALPVAEDESKIVKEEKKNVVEEAPQETAEQVIIEEKVEGEQEEAEKQQQQEQEHKAIKEDVVESPNPVEKKQQQPEQQIKPSTSKATSRKSSIKPAEEENHEDEEVDSQTEKRSICSYFQDYQEDREVLKKDDGEDELEQQNVVVVEKKQPKMALPTTLSIFVSPSFLNKIFSYTIREASTILTLTYVTSTWRRYFVESPKEFHTLQKEHALDQYLKEEAEIAEIEKQQQLQLQQEKESEEESAAHEDIMQKEIEKIESRHPSFSSKGKGSINNSATHSRSRSLQNPEQTQQQQQNENQNDRSRSHSRTSRGSSSSVSAAILNFKDPVRPKTSQIWQTTMSYQHSGLLQSSRALARFCRVGASWALEKAIRIGGAKLKGRGGVALKALQVAVEHQKIDCVRILVENGVDVLAFKAAALVRAAELNNEELLKILLTPTRELAQGRVNIHSWFEQTPLIGASRKGSEKCVDLLLDNSARVRTRNLAGKNAIEETSIDRYPEIVMKLSKVAEGESATPGPPSHSEKEDDGSSFEDFLDEEAPPPPEDEEEESEEKEEVLNETE